MLRTTTALAVLLLVTNTRLIIAQGTKADYDRADKLRQSTRNTVFRKSVKPHWDSDGNRFWYKISTGPKTHEFVFVDAVAGSRGAAFDHAAFAKVLAEDTGNEVPSDALPVSKLELDAGCNCVLIHAKSAKWEFNRETKKFTKLENDCLALLDDETDSPSAEAKEEPMPKPPMGRRSPDGKWGVFLRDHSLHLDGPDTKDTPLGSGTESDRYQQNHVSWSPDSKRFVALKTLAGENHVVSFVESAPGDQLQPKLHSHDYLKPGDRIPQSFPHLFDVETQAEIPISHELFPNPWMQTPQIQWAPDSSRFYFVYNQRGHQVLRVIAVDAESGEATTIVDEQSKTFVDYAFKQFFRLFHETNELIWMSERDGWNHLYLFDSLTGKVKNQITQGEWVVRRVDKVDTDKRQIWFQASGIYPDQDPYYIHFCRINFDGSGLTKLTDGDGTHSIAYSPDRRFIIDTYSRVDLPPVTELRSVETGELICGLEQADWTRLLKTGWQVPERFVAKGRDGKTDIHGVIFRPTTLGPSRLFPVIEKIYAGPHNSFVPKSFSEVFTAQEIAEIGFVVVQIDGMGTSNRSKAFHDVCWKNLGDSGFPDRILWIKAAAERYSYMNLGPGVGIYGGSAGGQSSTMAVLAHGDFYSVAVSDCGCHDNRMDKIWWNELWMSWPIGPHYAEQSNVTNAHRLKGKLFLTVGEVDRNVDPASTMQVVDALVKADKDFDLLVVPGKGHGVGETPYGKRRRRDFFVRHLLHVEPRRDPAAYPPGIAPYQE